MRSKKWYSLIALFALLVFALSACAPPAPPVPAEEEMAEEEEEMAEEEEEMAEEEEMPAGSAEFDIDAILASAGGDCVEPTGSEPLKIGYVADFSEVGGFADVPASEAAGYMVDLINCNGGLNGTPIEYEVFPADGLDVELTQRAAQDAVDAGMHAVLGPPFSDVGLPLLSVLNGEIPSFHVASTEVVMSDPSIYSFLLTYVDETQGHAAGEYAATEGGYATAVTLSSSDAPYFEETTAAFATAFEANGGEMLGDYSFGIGDEDYSSQVNEIASLDPVPDVIYTANIMPFVEIFVGQLRAAGLEDVAIMGADAFDATAIIDGGETTDGAIYTTHGFPYEGSRLATFDAAYEAANGEALPTLTIGQLGADAIAVIAQAYLASGEQLDPVAIGDAVLTLDSVDVVTVDEPISYAGQGNPVRLVTIAQNVDEEPTLLTQFIPGDY